MNLKLDDLFSDIYWLTIKELIVYLCRDIVDEFSDIIICSNRAEFSDHLIYNIQYYHSMTEKYFRFNRPQFYCECFIENNDYINSFAVSFFVEYKKAYFQYHVVYFNNVFTINEHIISLELGSKISQITKNIDEFKCDFEGYLLSKKIHNDKYSII